MRTNEIIVMGTDECGLRVAVNGENQRLSWADLDAARGQADAGLAEAYQRIHRDAAALAAGGPVVVSVHRDATNVWWVATVRALHGGGYAAYARRRDEGGTLPNHLLAACEAEDICQRLGERVALREGFDGPAAKARASEIQRTRHSPN